LGKEDRNSELGSQKHFDGVSYGFKKGGEKGNDGIKQPT
jgi:hypothetical protein